MATEKQTSANQENAKHSTGPTSQAGFDAIANNNFRHGLAGGDSHHTFTFLEGEDPEKFKELYARLAKDHSPQGETELILVHRMTESEWLRARALRLQAGSLDVGLEKRFALFLRYETTHERAFYRALNELQNIRKQSHNTEIGFESQKLKQAAETRAAEALNVKKDAQVLKREEFEYKKATAQMKNEARPAAKTGPDGLEMAA